MYFISILLILSSNFSLAESVRLSSQKIYKRCYSQFVQAPIPINDERMRLIKNGTLKPVEACVLLLEEGNLDSSGLIKNAYSTPNSVSQKVLQTFHDFHRSWFSANNLEQIQDYNEEINKGSRDVYDPNEQAYYLTNAFFANDQKYSDVLKGYIRYKGVRVENKELNRKIGLIWNYSFPSRVKYDSSIHDQLDINLIAFRSLNKAFDGNGDNRTDEDFSIAPKLQIGSLIGIQKNNESFLVKNLALEPLGRDRPGNNEPQLNYIFDLKNSFGGGVLGLPSYFLMNMGHGRGVKFNGTTKLPRRWIKAAFETFLCSQFPTLRESDILSQVRSDSQTPFRKASSCVQCHSTLDQAASIARNLTSGSTDHQVIDRGRNASAAKQPIVLVSYSPNHDAPTGWSDIENFNFHISYPKGKFFTRSLSGEMISKEIQSFDDLGQAMTLTSDFYTCAAKKYFEFLTGIKVPLYDRKDPRNAVINEALSVEHLADREFVESLGKELQRSQSLKDVVKRIIRSHYYLSENYR
jgi:hypothetical protein